MLLSDTRPDPLNTALLARPVRACLLVHELDGWEWQTLFTAGLAAMARFWGSQGDPVLPIPRTDAEAELFWELLARLDPDVIAEHHPLWQDVRELAPEAYAAQAKPIEAELERIGAEASVVEDHMTVPIAMPEIPTELRARLLARIAPLHLDPDGPTAFLSGEGGGIHPLADASKLPGLPAKLTELALSPDPFERLLLAMHVGALSPSLRSELVDAGVQVERKELPTAPQLARWLYQPRALNLASTPLTLGMKALAWFGSDPTAALSATVVVGDGAWDFALAHALRCFGHQAWWLPPAWVPDAERLAWVAQRMLTVTRRGVALTVTSASDEGGARALAEQLRSRPDGARLAAFAPWRDVLPARPARLLVRDLVSPGQPLALQGGRTGVLHTPVPELGEGAELELRWMTEVSIEDGRWPLMRHPASSQQVSDLPANLARAGADGFAYLSPPMLVRANVPLALQATRPAIEPVSALEQLIAVAAAGDWRCRPSEKGLYTSHAASLFGGFEELCAALSSAPVAAVLVAFLDGARDAAGLPLGDRRRYLTHEEIEKLAGGETSAFEMLLDANVLRRGVVLKCARCRFAAWYRPSEFDPSFSCKRCGAAQPVDGATLVDRAEPVWRYQLDEVIFQFLRHDGELPVLAAQSRFGDFRAPAGVVCELELRHEDARQVEVDFAVIRAGELWLGEAFTRPRYAKQEEPERLRELREVAELLGARGVLLATAAPALADITRERAQTAFDGSWPAWEEMAGCVHLKRPAKLIDAAPGD
jgi:hypothetical protein